MLGPPSLDLLNKTSTLAITNKIVHKIFYCLMYGQILSVVLPNSWKYDLSSHLLAACKIKYIVSIFLNFHPIIVQDKRKVFYLVPFSSQFINVVKRKTQPLIEMYIWLYNLSVDITSSNTWGMTMSAKWMYYHLPSLPHLLPTSQLCSSTLAQNNLLKTICSK